VHADILIVQGNSSHSGVDMETTEVQLDARGQIATSNFFLLDLANSALVRKPPTDAPITFVRECKAVREIASRSTKEVCSLPCVQPEIDDPSSYGESVLTKLLHNALVRGSGISVIVTANPQSRNIQETLSAIRYGTYVAGQKGGRIRRCREESW
jgi:hypothetical protein